MPACVVFDSAASWRPHIVDRHPVCCRAMLALWAARGNIADGVQVANGALPLVPTGARSASTSQICLTVNVQPVWHTWQRCTLQRVWRLRQHQACCEAVGRRCQRPKSIAHSDVQRVPCRAVRAGAHMTPSHSSRRSACGPSGRCACDMQAPHIVGRQSRIQRDSIACTAIAQAQTPDATHSAVDGIAANQRSTVDIIQANARIRDSDVNAHICDAIT